MTAQDHPFVRVYYSIIDDPRFERIYHDDRALAAWLRLLIEADAMYPAPAPLPRSANDRAVRLLCEVGLVELVNADHYRVHGLAAERVGRYAGGKGRSRYPSDDHSDSESGSESVSIPGRNGTYSDPDLARGRDAGDARAAPDLTSPDLTSPDQPAPADDLWNLYRALTKAVTLKPAALDWLDRIETAYGIGPAAIALREEHAKDGNPGTLLSRVNARLETAAKKAESGSAERQRSERIQIEVANRRLDEYRFTGKWRAEWGPKPVLERIANS